MDLVFTEDFKKELIAANLLMKESLHPWEEHVLSYYEGLKEDLHWKVLPTTAALVHRSLGINFRHTVYMTAIFRMVYFANYIHASIRDDEEGQNYDQQLQFTILIGDYISGAILKLLGDIDSHYLVPLFTQMTCEMNEGRVMRKLNSKKGPNLEILARESAPLYRNVFVSAATIARLPERERGIYQELGHNLGMAIAIQAENNLRSATFPFLEKVKALRLLMVRERWRDNGNALDNLVEELMAGSTGRKVAVV